MQLSGDELRRYARHLTLPEIGLAGQERIRSTRVLCVGTGGLGSPVLLYLAAAGVGALGVVDFDTVEFSNLQRQIIHRTPDVGRSKAASAHEKLADLNPGVEVVRHEVRLSRANALPILGNYDLVVDGTDNFPTRYLINDACVLLQKPNIHGSVFRFEGQATVLAPHLGGPCYRCLYPEPPPPGAVPSCAEAGVLGVLPGLIGLIQATEVLKLALGVGDALLNRLLVFDALAMRFKEVKLRRDPRCPLCGERPTLNGLTDYDQFCGLHPHPTNPMNHSDEVTVQDLKRALDDPALGITVLDVREPDEYRLASIAGAQPFPLSTLTQRFTELDPARSYYLHCKAGVRSMKALEFLRTHGFQQLKSVRGGILAWSSEIDSSVPKY